jgi:hypothetical protein
MNTEQEHLLTKIEAWAEEGLITPEQADALRQREEESPRAQMPARRVQVNEIFVYLGSLVIFLALAFLVSLRWEVMGGIGKILSVLIPAVAMLVLGWRLLGMDDERLRRGAQALWLGACLLSVVTFRVTLEELGLVPNEDLRLVVSFLLATGGAGLACLLLTTIAQSIAFHLCGSGALLALLLWLDRAFPPFNPWRTLVIVLVVGVLWLALAGWLRTREERGLLVMVSQLVGTLTILGWALVLVTQNYDLLWYKIAMEIIASLLSVAFIAMSVKWQSPVFLYTGAACLLALLAYVNLHHFADRVGMPVALFATGVLLIGLGLGTGRLSKRVRVAW